MADDELLKVTCPACETTGSVPSSAIPDFPFAEGMSCPTCKAEFAIYRKGEQVFITPKSATRPITAKA